MALASCWRRAVMTGAGLLALGACEAMTVAEAPQATAPVVDRSPRVASEIARGRQALEAGDLQAAQAAFTAALRGSPNDPDPAIGLAETYLALGDVATAGRLFDVVAATEAGGRDARLLQGRGLVALAQGRTSEAIGLLEQSVERNPAQWRAWAGLGRAYGRQGKSRQAHTAFERAEKAAPSPAVVMNDMGMLHLEENDPAGALEAFQRALAVDPGNATASANARIARAMLGDYDAAVSGSRPEELPHVLNNVGYVAVVNGDFDVADRLLRRAIETSPVYHEAARANLDLLAQAMKGVAVPRLAGSGVAARSTAGAELSSVAATPDQAGTGALAASSWLGEIAAAGASSGQARDVAAAGASSGPSGEVAVPDTSRPFVGEAAPAIVDGADIRPAAPVTAAAVTAPVTAPVTASVTAPVATPVTALATAPVTPATEGVMAHGFRWDSQPLSSARSAKKRGKRKPARSNASPEAADPRSTAWPSISVSAAEAAIATSEPNPDRATRDAQEPRSADIDAPTAPQETASKPASQPVRAASRPGLPE